MGHTGFDDSRLKEQLVERQLRLWNARRQAAREKLQTKSGYHFVTVAEDEGCLGTETAEELSVLLGWHVFDKEIVTYISRNRNISDKLVQELDQKSQNFIQDEIERLLKMPEFASFGSDEYHEALLETMVYLATQGGAIIIGRGGNFALRGNRNGLNVRFTASPDVRIQRLSEIWNVSPTEARHRMETDDKERRKFIRHYYYQDFDDPRFYDIQFNTDRGSERRIACCIRAFMHHTETSTARIQKAANS